MKKDANTILLFTEHRAAIDYLSDEDAGKLIKALFAYVDEGQLPDFNGPMMSLFMVIRTQIDRSHEAYKAKCERNSANAKKRFAIHSTSATASPGNPSQANVSERMPSHTDASLPNPTPNPIPNPDVSASRWGYARYPSPVWTDETDHQYMRERLPNVYQVFGHTQQESEPVITEQYACLDCRRAFLLTSKGNIIEA